MLRLATKQAKKSSFKYKIGAVILRGNSILGVGHNAINRYTSKWPQSWPGSLHAEEAAILDALNKHNPDKLIGSTIYVSRVDQSNQLALAMPCNHCRKILRAFHIKTCLYTTSTGLETLEL
jgi:cytidine deaminase